MKTWICNYEIELPALPIEPGTEAEALRLANVAFRERGRLSNLAYGSVLTTLREADLAAEAAGIDWLTRRTAP